MVAICVWRDHACFACNHMRVSVSSALLVYLHRIINFVCTWFVLLQELGTTRILLSSDTLKLSHYYTVSAHSKSLKTFGQTF